MAVGYPNLDAPRPGTIYPRQEFIDEEQPQYDQEKEELKSGLRCTQRMLGLVTFFLVI